MNLEPLRELETKWRDMAANEYRAAANAKEKGAEIAEVANESSAYAMRKCADDLSRALAQLDDGWRPIEEAPIDGTPVLVFHPQGGVCEGFCPGESFGWHVMDGTNTYIGQKSGKSLPILTTYMTPPTHFRPLPSPPAQDPQP